MNKSMKTLMISMLTLCICVTLVVGGTFALFTGSAKVNNHLVAGNLNIALSRISYTETVLTAEGFLQDQPNNTTVDLLENGDNVFTVDRSAPGCSYQATIKIENKGTVAFKYGMRLVEVKGYDADGTNVALTASNLADQLQITIYQGSTSSTPIASFALNDYLTIGANSDGDIDIGVLAVSQSNNFIVKVEFVDGANNNAAQLEKVEFDIQVYAVQETKKPA